jgi:hypothetical protein
MDRYEASWQLLASYLYGLLIGNLIVLPLAALLTLAWHGGTTIDVSTLLGGLLAGVATLLVTFMMSIIGGALLALPILVLCWLVLLLLFERIHAHLRVWCILAPIAVGGVWLLGEYANLAHAAGRFGWSGFMPAVGPRFALALMCSAFASMRYYRTARDCGRAW